MLYTASNVLFPLILSAYISQKLLAEGVGKVVYAQTIATYFTTIASLGLPIYGVKVIAQCGEDVQSRTRRFCELFSINAFSTFICAAAYFVFVNHFPHFFGREMLFNVMGILLIMNFFNISWFYQGIEEYKFIAVRGIVVKIVSLAATILFVKDTEDFIIYALIYCLGVCGNNIANMCNLHNHVDLLSAKNNIHIKQHIRPLLFMLASALATEVYTMLDSTMLEYFYGEAYVGYYSNSVKIVRVVYSVITAGVATFYPRISLFIKRGEFSDSNRLLGIGTHIIILLGIPAVLGLALVADCMVPLLFGSSFLPAISSMRVLSILIMVFAVSYFLGHIVLIATGNEKHILFTTVAAALINFTLNSLLIPVYKHVGASVASVIAECTVGLLLITKARKYFEIKVKPSFIASIIISNVAMVISVVTVKMLCTDVLVCLLASVFIGAGSYLLALTLSKNPVIMEFWATVKNKTRKKIS